MTHWLIDVFSDLFIELSEIAHHAPLGPSDPDLAPGWYFTMPQDLAAVVDNVTPTMFRMAPFCTVFHQGPPGLSITFQLHVTYMHSAHRIDATWKAFSEQPFEGSFYSTCQEVSWDTVWQTLVLGDRASDT
jgi:hypothetical protein